MYSAFITGLVAAGTRRSITARLDAKMERPSERQFKNDPVAMVIRDRGKYIAACLSIISAYIEAGCPCKLTPFNSFSDWSDTVRGALVWLGCADPVETVKEAIDDDPERLAIGAFLAAMQTIGIGKGSAISAAAIIAKAQHAPKPTLPSLDEERKPMPIARDEERPMPNARRPRAGRTKGNSYAFKHGRYTAEVVAERRRFRELVREMRRSIGRIEVN